VENFFVVQCVKLRKHATIADTRTNTELSALSTVKPPSGMTALRSTRRRSLDSAHGKIAYHGSNRKTCGQRFARHRKRRSLSRKAGAENERPVRGDNRTGQAIWALGVDGRSRRIQPMGRDYRSHIDKSQHLAERSKRRAIFLTFCLERLPQKSRRSTLFCGVCGRFLRRHRRQGVIQRPAHGSVIGRRVERRRFFARRLA
jgi:hypothetical protein